jgi:hypothetical protein
LALLRADTLAQWWPVMRGLDIAVGVMLVSLAAFVWVYFGTGKKWLTWLVPCLYVAGLMFDYLPGGGMCRRAFKNTQWCAMLNDPGWAAARHRAARGQV